LPSRPAKLAVAMALFIPCRRHAAAIRRQHRPPRRM